MVLNWLHTEVNEIKDVDGNTVLLTGCDWMEPVWLPSLDFDLNARADRMKELGVGCVRVSMNAWLWRERASEYRPFIDSIINALGQRGIYTLLFLLKDKSAYAWTDAEEIAAMQNPDPIITFWKEVAQRYANNPSCAGYSIWPATFPTSGYTVETLTALWHPLALRIAREIHAINPNVLVFVPDVGPSQIRGFAVSPLDEPNIVYDIHRYYYNAIASGTSYATSYVNGNFALAKQQLEWVYKPLFLDFAMSYPVVMTEMGSRLVDPNWDIEAQDECELLARYGVGHIQHVWYPVELNEFGLTVQADWLTLSPLGEVWKAGLVPLPMPMPTPIPILPIALGIGAIVAVIGGIAYYSSKHKKRGK